MNLSARLGTASNMGDLDNPSVRNALIIGNLALLQVQAAVVSFIAACFTFFLSTIIPGMGEDQSEPLPVDTRDPFRHYLRTAGQGLSLRRPRPMPPPAGAPKSGFFECVRVRDRRLPSFTCFVTDSWCSRLRPCRPHASPQFYLVRSCASLSSFAESGAVTLVWSKFRLSLFLGLCSVRR
jgi:hypothetical protein